MSNLLEVRDINAFYDEAHILYDVSLNIERGDVVCLIGRNGVGKTTTLKSIMGLVETRGGKVLYDNEDITDLSTDAIYRKTRIGYTPEERRIFSSLTVRENLLIGQLPFKKKGRWNLETVLDLFPSLKNKQGNSGAHLSGGEQQMLAIGRGLMANPELILLDEPCEGLAPIIVQELEDAIKMLHETGITILLVEQSLTISKNIGKRFHLMSKGSIEYSCDRDELFENTKIIEKYMGVGF